MFTMFKRSTLNSESLEDLAKSCGAKLHWYESNVVVDAPLGARWRYNESHHIFQSFTDKTKGTAVQQLIYGINQGFLRCVDSECKSCESLFFETDDDTTVQLNIPRDIYHVCI